MKIPFFDQEEEIDPITGLPKAQAPVAPTVESVEAPKVDVKQYLTDKYGLNTKYSNEARDKVAEDTKIGMGEGLVAALSAIGAGFQGKDSGAAGMGALNNFKANADKKLTQFDAGRKQAIEQQDLDRKSQDFEMRSNPDSEFSIAKRQAFQDAYGVNLPPTMSAAQLDELSPALSKKIDTQFRERELKERMKDRQLQREAMQYNRDQTRQEKQKTIDEKKKTTLNEVEDRRTNIEDNITKLENMIKEKGTFEVFGSHNQDMDRLTDLIATDMAKLTDPNSVARPSEVEMFKKGLVQSGFSNKNSTALDILKNFRGEVNKRAENAYKIRGQENPGSQAEKGQSEEIKTVGSKKYRKVTGGWEEV